MHLNNPYKGLFQYTPKDEAFFFGRDAETTDLLEMIKNNQLVILYGDSGTGKTSLINAKLFPELKRKYYFPIYIRLNFLNNIDPLTQMREIMYKELSAWDKNVPKFTNDLSLIEYAARTSIFNGLVKPILFFDQFEELFTLGQKYVNPELIEKFVTQISDLIEVRIPAFGNTSQISRGKIHDILNKEIYTENIMRFTVVISMRQDYIAQLDDLRFKIPSIVFNRYRLKKFDDNQAKDAIIKPALVYSQEIFKDSPSFEIVDDVTANEIIIQLKTIESRKYNDTPLPAPSALQVLKRFAVSILNVIKGVKIVQELSPVIKQQFYNIEIDPTILSLYCLQLYKEASDGSGGLKKITKGQVIKSPCDKVIENYYNESLESRKIRINTETLLITPDGRRTLMLLDNFISRSKIDVKDIEKLKEETGIYRIYGEGRERELEIAHDQIAKRALINKRQREANQIKVITGVFSLVFIAIVIAGYIAAKVYIDQQKKSYTVTSLRQTVQKIEDERNVLTNKLEQQSDSLETLKSYNLELFKRNQAQLNSNSIRFNNLITESQSKLEKQTNELSQTKRNLQELNNKYNIALKSLSVEQAKNDPKQMADIRSEFRDKTNKYNQLIQDLNTIKASNKILNDSLTKYKTITIDLQKNIKVLEGRRNYEQDKKQYKK